MKRSVFIIVAVIALAIAAQAFAAPSRSCKVTGDAAKSGVLMIDINWTVDTAQYPGESTQSIRKKVGDDIWKDLLPELVKKTSGFAVSYDKSNFTRVSETSKLIEERPDGSKVYSYNTKVQFNCAQSGDAAPVASEKERKSKMDDEFHYRFVREGFD